MATTWTAPSCTRAPTTAGCAATCRARCSSPAGDYDGGELVIAEALGEKRIKLPAGDMILYPSSTVHQVAPVTRGHRVSSFSGWRSMVRGLEQRQLLFDMDMALLKLRQTHGDTDPSAIAAVGHVPQPAAHVGRCENPQTPNPTAATGDMRHPANYYFDSTQRMIH